MAPRLIATLVVLPVLAFYLWMFRDLTRNDRLGPDERRTWAWLFLLLNVFAAAMYYQREYRRPR